MGLPAAEAEIEKGRTTAIRLHGERDLVLSLLVGPLAAAVLPTCALA